MKRGDSLPSFVVTEPMEVIIANPVAKVKDDTELNIWLVFGLVLIILSAVLLFFNLRNKSQQSETELTPKEQFLKKLTEIKNSSGSEMKNFQTQLFHALSKYLVTEYSINVSQIDKDLLVNELSKAGMSLKNGEKIVGWLQQAEIDKFAPITQSPGAVVRLESEIRTFFEKI